MNWIVFKEKKKCTENWSCRSVLTAINFNDADNIRLYSMDFTNFVNQWNTIDTNIQTNPGRQV